VTGPSDPGPAPILREQVAPSDRTKLFKLIQDCGAFYPHEMAYGMGLFDEHLLRGENSSHQFMLYEQDGSLIAYGCFGPLPLTDRRYHLYWLVVGSGASSKGIGKALESAIAKRVRTQGGVRLYAETSNRATHEGARQFYEHCGYRLDTVTPDYYGDGHDKVVYVKDL
jgi:ribosomal protein S18 acetylase RimI-like enzyme